jgi:hypothetical protein
MPLMFKVKMVAPWFIQNINLNQTLYLQVRNICVRFEVYMDLTFKTWK